MKLATRIFAAVTATLTTAGAAAAFDGSELEWGAKLAATVQAAGIELVSSDQPPPEADNTGRNVRDRDDRLPTPTDQGNSETDRDITAHIRKEIVANDALSTNAHNVKIITIDGIVTLRGPVKSVQEKAAVAAAAHRAPGVKRVDDQIEVEHTD
jgi:osmotically-inducible protein OsmY